MVNKIWTEKLKREQPSLTIYPFSIDELKEPKLFHEAIDKNAKRITKIQNEESLEKNTQKKIIKQTLTETQQETEQIVKQMDIMFELLCFCSILDFQLMYFLIFRILHAFQFFILCILLLSLLI